MTPHQGRAIDTVNFRNVKDSQSSMDMGNSNSSSNGLTMHSGNTNGASGKGGGAGAGAKDSGGSSGVPGGVGGGLGKGGVTKDGALGIPAAGLKGVPLDSGLATPGGEIVDPFEEFNSVTLHHAGDGGMVASLGRGPEDAAAGVLCCGWLKAKKGLLAGKEKGRNISPRGGGYSDGKQEKVGHDTSWCERESGWDVQ
ncbi:uncharacterized protein KY384_007955 [Bacidia gigantensis]|uniref:uncharacterized protein n=1 Tax=Bacidia gigantensis TaxID=2732470 RepID=UPI001D0463D9|nr:uncharacterized protein KY384_007955 [Bacidia gigantensis]KAG8527801.1 hypothetical protein KY384_007955 [Bacidia gigantensis]